jgi:RecJ-like exonuclease
MGKNRFGLWLGLAVATLVGVGVAAYLVLRHERAQSELNEVQRLIQRSQDIVQRLESELDSRASPDTSASRA